MTGINQRGRYGRYIQWILTGVDFLILNAVFFITARLTPEFIMERTRTVWLLANICYMHAAYLMSHTQTSRRIAMEHVLTNSFRSILIHALLFIFGLFFLQIDQIPWRAFAEFYGLLIILLPLWWMVSRILVKKLRRHGWNFSTIVIVGANPTARRLYQEIVSDTGIGYRCMGIFDDEPHPGIPADVYRGTLNELDDYIREHKIDEIFCTLSGEREDDINHVRETAEANVSRFYFVPQLSRYAVGNFDMYALGSIPVMAVRHQPLSRFRNRLVKRAFDVAFSATVLLFSPLVFIPVAIAIKLSSPGPIFFKQKRTGYRGREFYCYKFRTMRVNKSADTQQATKNDPRKTRVGDFLRRTSIDELPQFINVFIGNMSVVGPRPHMLKHTEQYSHLIKKYMVRHYIKPGITGWAQINGFRGQTEELWQMEQRVEHDVWYIEHWNPLLDLKIIFRTVTNAIHGEKNAF